MAGYWTAAAAAAPYVIKGLSSLFGSNKKKVSSGSSTVTELGNTSVNSMSPEDQQLLRVLSGTSANNAAGFGREQALADSSGLINSAIRSLQEKGIPDILKSSVAAGAYSSPMDSLLANDLVARSGEAVGRQQADIIANYGQVQNQGNATAAQILEALKGAQVDTTVDTTTNTNWKGTAPNSGGNLASTAMALAQGISAYQNTNASGANGQPAIVSGPKI